MEPVCFKLGLNDQAILGVLPALLSRSPMDREPPRCIIALDAPLSYQPGGGFRPADRALADHLRATVVSPGYRPGVMAPTMTRMAYLTLRGVSLTRLLLHPAADLAVAPEIVEVYPAGSLLLRGAPVDAVRDLRTSPAARVDLLAVLRDRTAADLPDELAETDHAIAATAGALAALDFARGRVAWHHPADPPHHPFAFIC